jgi:hypothetical protein
MVSRNHLSHACALISFLSDNEMSLFRSGITESAHASEDQIYATEFEGAGLRLEAGCVCECADETNGELPMMTMGQPNAEDPWLCRGQSQISAA